MTAVIPWLPCAGFSLLSLFCLWMGRRRDRAALVQWVISYAEGLCRAAAADIHPTTEETDPS